MRVGRTRGYLAVILGLVGAVLLTASVFTGWYTVSFSARGSGASQSATETFFPGPDYQYAASCSGNGSYCSTAAGTAGSQSYHTGRLNSTGSLYGWLEGLVLLGVVAGFGAVLASALYATGRIARRRLAVALLMVAILVAFAGPVYVAASQPPALAADYPGSTGGGPSGSFIGSCSGTGCTNGLGTGFSGSWGPDVGWYTSWAAFAGFLAGVAVLLAPSTAPPPPPLPDSGPETDASAPAEGPNPEFWQDPPTE